jgi:DNA-binding response OmpR family regulator
MLLDLMIPINAGMKVCEKLKGNDEVENIPVIMLTVKNK